MSHVTNHNSPIEWERRQKKKEEERKARYERDKKTGRTSHSKKYNKKFLTGLNNWIEYSHAKD